MYIPPQEAHLGYIIGTVVALVAVAVGLGVIYVRHENRPASRPSLVVIRRAVPRPRRVVPGDLCVCGGTIGKSGRTSDRFGELLGCTGCERSWTMDGRKIIRRRAGTSRQAQEPAD
jgi:hypothetical protein